MIRYSGLIYVWSNSEKYKETNELSKHEVKYFQDLQTVADKKRTLTSLTPKPARILTIEGFRKKFIKKSRNKNKNYNVSQEFSPTPSTVEPKDVSAPKKLKQRYTTQNCSLLLGVILNH